MSRPRPTVKRGLREVLEAGVAQDAAQNSRAVTTVFDVHTSSGDKIGMAIHAPDGRPVYVTPPQLEGVEVCHPMILKSTPNPRCLATALGVSVKGELSR